MCTVEDIGDEQSLAESLSTFTGHLTQVRNLLNAVGEARSLVLLDEIGAGTDPLEGGALACAILTTLAEAGAVTVATTHLGVVKTFAHDAPHMVNGAVRFNTSSLTPEYALDFGAPGASQALTIARRVGVPEAVLQRATEMMSGDHLRLETMLASIEEAQRQISQREEQIKSTLSNLKGEREQVRAELEQLTKDRRKLLHEAYEQADGIVANTRREMERLVAGTRKAAENVESVAVAAASATAAAELAARQSELRNTIRDREDKVRRALAETAARPVQPLAAKELAVGRKIWVEKLQTNARIEAVSDDCRRVIVSTAGGVRFTVSSKEIGQGDARVPDPELPRPHEGRPRVQGRIEHELNLIGQRVDDAEPLLQHFLDRAVLGGLTEVRVVHGFGTGRLQEGVHALLRRDARVAGFRIGRGGQDPGGGGATHVRLKST